jgi:transcriptional regulator GlxA family with amidase domain
MKTNGADYSRRPVQNWADVSAMHLERPGHGSPTPQNGETAEHAKRIEQSIVYMRQHLDKPFQVSALAALAKVSPSHFFALFKRETGHTPIDFFIHLRMRHACELLMKTTLSVKEVAASLGYDDQFYFSRVFKSVNHVAPSEYRVRLARAGQMTRLMALTRPERRNSEKDLPSLSALEPAPTQPELKPENASWKLR